MGRSSSVQWYTECKIENFINSTKIFLRKFKQIQKNFCHKIVTKFHFQPYGTLYSGYSKMYWLYVCFFFNKKKIYITIQKHYYKQTSMHTGTEGEQKPQNHCCVCKILDLLCFSKIKKSLAKIRIRQNNNATELLHEVGLRHKRRLEACREIGRQMLVSSNEPINVHLFVFLQVVDSG